MSGDLKVENELLLLQLRQLQEELESYYFEARKAIDEREELILEQQRLGQTLTEMQRSLDWKIKELDQARNTISMVFASWSWRLTRPMRVIVRVLRGQPVRSKAS